MTHFFIDGPNTNSASRISEDWQLQPAFFYGAFKAGEDAFSKIIFQKF